MFTIYITILESLAMNMEGQYVATITDMSGGLLTNQKTLSHLRDLKREGFVTQDEIDTLKWHITNKALEYCWTVNNRRDNAERGYNATKMHEGNVENGIAPTQDAITEVSEIPHALSIDSTKILMPLMGEMTIHEAIEAIESSSAVKVTRADLSDGIVTLKIEQIHEPVNTAYNADFGYWNEYGEFNYFDEEDTD